MIVLRSFLYQLFLVTSSIVFSSLILSIGWIKMPSAAARLSRTWARSNLVALRVICHLNYRVRDFDRCLPQNAIILCKHQSAWETIALRALLPLEQTWVLKQELMRIPLFGWALGYLKPIAIDRSAGRRAVSKVIREGTERLAEGRWVIVFPEGTRVAPGTRHAYAIGGALLAERTGCPVIPVAHNAGCFWGRRSFVKRPGTIDLVFGPTIDVAGKKSIEINLMAEKWIEATVDGLPKS
jgi:1-acyl-sn-glycerol-3-phosphate acyltransferase